MKLLSFGEVLWDVYPNKKCLGGAPLNFAAHFSKLGGEAYILSAIGNDEFKTETLKKLEAWGVCKDYLCISDNYPTGVCNVTLNENAIPQYDLKQNVAYDHISCDNIKADFDVLYFGSMALRSDFNKNSVITLLENKEFKEVFVDVNIRPPFYTKETVKFCLNNATIIKISDEELSTINNCISIKETDIENNIKAIFRKFTQLRLIIITKGAKGSLCYDALSDKFYNCKAKKVNVVSTVGAGDSFSAAFLFKYSGGENIDSCLEFASALSAYVCSNIDAVPELYV